MYLYLQIIVVSIFLTIPTMLMTVFVFMLFQVSNGNDRENNKHFK